jgi:hypothetical protein
VGRDYSCRCPSVKRCSCLRRIVCLDASLLFSFPLAIASSCWLLLRTNSSPLPILRFGITAMSLAAARAFRFTLNLRTSRAFSRLPKFSLRQHILLPVLLCLSAVLLCYWAVGLLAAVSNPISFLLTCGWELCWTFIYLKWMNWWNNKSSFVGDFFNILFFKFVPTKIAKGHFFLNNLLTVFCSEAPLKKSDLFFHRPNSLSSNMFVTVIRAECRYTIVMIWL